MADDEVPDLLNLDPALAVERSHLHVLGPPMREVLDQSGHHGLDQVDAGGLQRLQEAARQADRHHVAVPLFHATARSEADPPRLSQGHGSEVA